jgi:methionyl-tRNA formyltransferase
MKIIFMGTPKFACPTLEKLIADDKFEVIAVYSREPQVAGRGHKLRNSPIHQLALKNDLQIFTPKSLRDSETQKEFVNLKADAAVVVAYGLILPQEILSGTQFGCFNIHPSLLPKWRGAAPIQRTIMAQDQETAVCIIKMDAGLDSGDVVACEKFSLNGTESYSELEEKFSEVGGNMVVETLKKADDESLVESAQDHSLMTYAKKLNKSECEIDFSKSAQEVDAQIRGLNGSLGAFFMYQGEKLKIFTCEIIDENSCGGEVGKVNERFEIQCGSGVIRPSVLQKPGKSRVKIDEFLLGLR